MQLEVLGGGATFELASLGSGALAAGDTRQVEVRCSGGGAASALLLVRACVAPSTQPRPFTFPLRLRYCALQTGARVWVASCRL
jgi:hypothetical protein